MKAKSPKKRKWLRMLLITVGILFILGYASKRYLERVVIAYVISGQGTFIPPPGIGHWDKLVFYWDLSALRVAREERLKRYDPLLKPILKEITHRQGAGESMPYSMNIYREVRWRLNFTPDTAITHRRILDLRRSLSQISEQAQAGQQQSSDGSWAMGIDAWYLRLYYSADQAKDSVMVRYPMHFLDRINSPEKLKAGLDSVLYDDFTKTGIFNREQLDETLSALTRLIFATRPITYSFDPKLQQALINYINAWQNPTTGCWGQWMVDRHGKIWKMDDMAMTFHVISDLHGEVNQKDLIAKHILTLDKVEFPAGIRFEGNYENHLNWDVVKILKYTWSALDSATREKGRKQIRKMLDWCLQQSYQTDGSFKISKLDATLDDAYFYGVSFLSDAGYFDKRKCFWSNQVFMQADSVRAQILTKLSKISSKDPEIQEAAGILRGQN
jgi:hypothetical protein